MSSEMRVTDAMVEAALDGLDNACMDIAKRELQPHDVLWRGFSRIRRMEAMRAALNAALLARTEAGADGGAPICLFDATNPCDGTCGECHHLRRSIPGAQETEYRALYTATPTAAADSERLDWVINHPGQVVTKWGHESSWHVVGAITGHIISRGHASYREAIDAAMRQEGGSDE